MEQTKEYFPDGTAIDEWFYDLTIPTLKDLGQQYRITDYGVVDDGLVHTAEFQNVIDAAFENGGGVIVVPARTYQTAVMYW